MTSMSLWYQTKDNDIYNKLQNAPPKSLKTYKNNLNNVNATRTNKIIFFVEVTIKSTNFEKCWFFKFFLCNEYEDLFLNVSDFHVNFKKCSCGINPFL